MPKFKPGNKSEHKVKTALPRKKAVKKTAKKSK